MIVLSFGRLKANWVVWILALNVCSFLVAFSSVLAAHEFTLQKPLRWGYYDFPPYIYTDEHGDPAGEMAMVLDGLMNDLDIPYQPLVYPNRRFIKLLEEQQLDFSFSVKASFKQPENVIFSRFPIRVVEFRVYWLNGETPNVTQVEDLIGKPLLTIAGFNYGGLTDTPPFNEMRSTIVENHERALNALVLGRASYLLAYRFPTEQAILNTESVSLNYFSVRKTPVFMALNSKVANASELMSQLENSYQKLFSKQNITDND